jgi:hypothetical protein
MAYVFRNIQGFVLKYLRAKVAFFERKSKKARCRHDSLYLKLFYEDVREKSKDSSAHDTLGK